MTKTCLLKKEVAQSSQHIYSIVLCVVGYNDNEVSSVKSIEMSFHPLARYLSDRGPLRHR